jgi:hypothetical protein
MNNQKEKQKVYIVLDYDAPPKNSIWSVNSTMEKAIESEKALNDMRVGGADTKIIVENID